MIGYNHRHRLCEWIDAGLTEHPAFLESYARVAGDRDLERVTCETCRAYSSEIALLRSNR